MKTVKIKQETRNQEPETNPSGSVFRTFEYAEQ
jgi:hypothetical protein